MPRSKVVPGRLLWRPIHVLPVCLLFQAATAHARDPASEEAIRLFDEGQKKLGRSMWSDALERFSRSSALRPHPIVSYNMGYCERALGHYTRAREQFAQALAASKDHPDPLTEQELDAARTYMGEIDGLLAHVRLTVEPAGVAIAVDGRPPAPMPPVGGLPVLVAGTRNAGPAEVPPASTFELVVDPGVHLITLSRKGFTNAFLNQTFDPGARTSLHIPLDRLPAVLHVGADQDRAIVTLNKEDEGPVPVTVKRPAGDYQVVVKKVGFIPYEARIAVSPGEEANLLAALKAYRAPIYKKWWFWTGLAAAAGAIAGVSVGLTLPPPPYQTGNTGWLLRPR